MDIAFIEDLQEDGEFLTDLGNGLWLMDDHKWALYIWDRYRAHSGIHRFSLFHADYHWDGVNDFRDAPAELEILLKADEDVLFERIKEERLVQYDSFIAPAVMRGLFDEVHFYCKQDDGSDIGIDDEALNIGKTKQFIHENTDTVTALNFPSPLIFDLCLDLFNKSDYHYQSDLWSDEEILNFLTSVKQLVAQARIVTVSLSFVFSGTEEDTRRLAKLVLPVLADWRTS